MTTPTAPEVPVHGLVLTALQKHVEERYGPATWSALLLAAELPGRAYSATGRYPDAEVLAVVEAAARATGTSQAQVLEALGRALAPDLLAAYGSLVQPRWDALDVIASTEQALHSVVRAREGATPPVLEVNRLNPDRLTVRYTSSRRLCALAKGIAKGLGDHYRTPLEVTESACMTKGSSHCLLEVARVRVAAPAPRRAPAESAPEVRIW